MKVLAVTIVMGQRFFAKRYKRCQEDFLRFMRDVFRIVIVHDIHNMVKTPSQIFHCIPFSQFI